MGNDGGIGSQFDAGGDPDVDAHTDGPAESMDAGRALIVEELRELDQPLEPDKWGNAIVGGLGGGAVGAASASVSIVEGAIEGAGKAAGNAVTEAVTSAGGEALGQASTVYWRVFGA